MPTTTPAEAPVTTPLRERAVPAADAADRPTLLRDAGNPYRDGGEEQVLRIVREARDHGSSSVEMLLRAEGWAQRYHLDPTRVNILRPLALPRTARVLEIGAGCGAITRYLGERCALVDALEPVSVRAESAAARCADLASTRVFVGELDDVPDAAAYDVVIVIGVLEYVGRGSADREPYLRFLRGIASRLVPGGTLVLAIENRLGVKYLAGSPEDHTDRAFDSLEGYPSGGKARTFSRRELEALLRAAGLEPATRVAFPDYKMTRAVFGPGVPDAARSLLHRVPDFPSPDWRTPRARLADERSTWRGLVDAGLEIECGNSFLVLAGTPAGGPASAPLWPDGQAGAFYTTDRRPELNTGTVIETVPAPDGTGETVRLRRTALNPVAGAPDAAIRVAESVQDFQPGTDLTAVLAAAGVPALEPLVEQWLALVDAALADDPATAIDVVPHNMVRGPDGRLRVIDVEFTGAPIGRDALIRRGTFWLAVRAAPLAPPARWAPATTVGELMSALGALAGLPADGSWIAQTITDEAAFLTRVRPGPPAGRSPDEWRAEYATRLRGRVSRRLADLPLGTRAPEQLRRARAEAKDARAQVATLRGQLDRAVAARGRLERSVEVRAGRRIRPVLGRWLPRGSRRRSLAVRLAARVLGEQ